MNNLATTNTAPPTITVTMINPSGHHTEVVRHGHPVWLKIEGKCKTVATETGCVIYMKHDTLNQADQFAQANNKR